MKKYKLKEKLIVKNWADMKLMFNDTRQEIIDLCSVEPKSIKELSDHLELNPGSVHNHIKKLFNAGYLQVCETRIINGIEEKKYLRSAKFFSFAELKDEENIIRNKFIAKELGKEVFEILERDNKTSAVINKVQLSDKNHKIAQDKLQDLISFLNENNGSGEIRSSFVACFGKR
ncbi:winged helix-turn-helix domain-containing protein [Halobacteriovorax sp. GB3]|uniref:ArsR family transcriptional regulator n=1 Tax=Halobacteriovorax sp. GB3 TaxID=2719615 RepID=UPI00236307F0|nr:winged helix-turn-helix domain-containing protein [Halobacteriovorax sp. GB3]MDD0853638.1 winged helix-turn-helix domain-containing protein [Halobacteriovorax sp. GB3]